LKNNNVFKIPTSTLPNFIKSIKFPLFKKITPNSEIVFNHGFTVLVGANGCGKSSALQALYGCPKGKNTGDFWFSTQIDPIVENPTGPHRYIYQYHINELKKDVWITNTRAKRENNLNRRDNPDYWETSKPRKRDELEPLSNEIAVNEEDFRTKTRWNPIEKDVVYVDFRSELSAFDKCFNFGTFRKTKKIKSIQDFIRFRSGPLKSAYSRENSYHWYGMSNEPKKKISDETLREISLILGKEYQEAYIMDHNYFDSKGLSIFFKEKNSKYSEALAGSGEVAVVTCVEKIRSAQPGSLILLDEPEVSLHPGAQRAFRDFLLKQILEKKHQIVLCTHSPYFIEDLPNNAIKLFYPIESADYTTYSVLNEIHPEDAFSRLGVKNNQKSKIYVEDILAKLVLEKALNENRNLIDQDNIEILIYPGGECTIKNNMLSFLFNNESSKIAIFLDGDAKPTQKKISNKILENETYSDLKMKLKELTKTEIKLPIDSNMKDHEKRKVYLNSIKTYERKFFFGNTNTPEELIWKTSKKSIEYSEKDQNYKKRFENITTLEVGDSTSSEILFMQKIFINKIDIDNELWTELVEIVKKIICEIRP
jgi:predicted ATP-dependent endonuclease of OLD family